MTQNALNAALPAFNAGFGRLVDAIKGADKGPIALGVSGGSDSLALLYLASEWARKNNRKLLVLTVDHQLRPESATEAAYVKRLTQALGHQHICCVWETPRSGQNAARTARLQLLCQAMQAHGARLLLLGHTLNDVLETALMRRQRGIRGWSAVGPAAIAPAPIWPFGRGITLVRPLLGYERRDLQALLQAWEIEWYSDPSNSDDKYERARMRAHLRRHPAWLQKLRAHLLQTLQARAVADQALATALRQRVTVYKSGLLLLATASPDTRLLSCVTRYAAGHDQPPRRDALQRLVDANLAPGARRVLGGAWFQRTAQGYLIGRDPAVWPEAPKHGLWDGRFAPDETADFPLDTAQPFLLRTTAPQTPAWREILSERIAFEAASFDAHRVFYET